MVVRRERGELEQLEERLVRDRLSPERLVGPPCGGEFGEAHARWADTCTAAPACRNNWENGQPSSAFATASCRPASSRPSAVAAIWTCDATIWCPRPSTSSITIV